MVDIYRIKHAGSWLTTDVGYTGLHEGNVIEGTIHKICNSYPYLIYYQNIELFKRRNDGKFVKCSDYELDIFNMILENYGQN